MLRIEERLFREFFLQMGDLNLSLAKAASGLVSLVPVKLSFTGRGSRVQIFD